jgi:sulfite exporter TauE/SafE
MSDLIIAFSLGLLSAPHCIGMCGSIATALLMSAQRSSETSNAEHCPSASSQQAAHRNMRYQRQLAQYTTPSCLVAANSLPMSC